MAGKLTIERLLYLNSMMIGKMQILTETVPTPFVKNISEFKRFRERVKND